MSVNKIAVIGCGAVGLNYATRLLEAQIFHHIPLDVNLVVRRDFDILSKHGVLVEYGKESDEVPINKLLFTSEQLHGILYESTKDLASVKGHMDWVIISCKSYSIDETLRDLLLPLNGPTTKYLIIMNGLGVEDSFIEWFGADKVYGALSHIACNRGPNPPVELGPLKLHVFADILFEVGHVTDDPNKLAAVTELFAHSTVVPMLVLSPNLLKSRWAKLCWNITFAGIAVAMGGLTSDIVNTDPSLHELADSVVSDIVAVANADILRQHRARHSGTAEGAAIPPCPHLLDLATIREGIWSRTRSAGAYKSSTVLDLVQGSEMEVRYMFQAPLEHAR